MGPILSAMRKKNCAPPPLTQEYIRIDIITITFTNISITTIHRLTRYSGFGGTFISIVPHLNYCTL